jgi:ABC-type sugar transport system permease subunit
MKSRPPIAFIAVFLAPAVILYGIFVLLPAANAFRYSLMRWDGLSDPVWVGFKNFESIFRSGDVFLGALYHNAYLMAVPGAITIALALFFAYTLHRGLVGGRLFRITFFFPNVISSVAISILWILIYSPTGAGLLNNILKSVFHYQHPIPFTQSSRLLTALPPMIVWSATGFYMVLFLAAMENIPETYYEAAKLDGASNSRLFFGITLPLMWDVLTTGVVYMVIGSLKMFDMIWIMENGRPSKDTHTIASLMYSKVFEEYNIGYGSAIAVFLFLLILLATRITFRFMRRERLEY